MSAQLLHMAMHCFKLESFSSSQEVAHLVQTSAQAFAVSALVSFSRFLHRAMQSSISLIRSASAYLPPFYLK